MCSRCPASPRPNRCLPPALGTSSIWWAISGPSCGELARSIRHDLAGYNRVLKCKPSIQSLRALSRGIATSMHLSSKTSAISWPDGSDSKVPATSSLG
ncbi:hypothetical protein PAXRUDRAFT_486044 [Paxillus rubicundulus Ve08.2h10]|uniref:Uncharacterized protein n=1 Tax=Paxillus rubicundulus Ve08.2h10 TaxID=930991 RepID=A0A0D0E7F6_9AGAM|nr:hypothetical protein PAXRUDRAFT_486044 [Paxillus rubicundulus Ve08.2h10]